MVVGSRILGISLLVAAGLEGRVVQDSNQYANAPSSTNKSAGSKLSESKIKESISPVTKEYSKDQAKREPLPKTIEKSEKSTKPATLKDEGEPSKKTTGSYGGPATSKDSDKKYGTGDSKRTGNTKQESKKGIDGSSVIDNLTKLGEKVIDPAVGNIDKLGQEVTKNIETGTKAAGLGDPLEAHIESDLENPPRNKAYKGSPTPIKEDKDNRPSKPVEAKTSPKPIKDKKDVKPSKNNSSGMTKPDEKIAPLPVPGKDTKEKNSDNKSNYGSKDEAGGKITSTPIPVPNDKGKKPSKDGKKEPASPSKKNDKELKSNNKGNYDTEEKDDEKIAPVPIPEINDKEPKSNNKGDYDAEEKDDEKIAPVPIPEINDKEPKSNNKGDYDAEEKDDEKIAPVPIPEINDKEPKSNNKGDYDTEEKDDEKIAPVPIPEINDKEPKSNNKGDYDAEEKDDEKIAPVPIPEINDKEPKSNNKGDYDAEEKDDEKIAPVPIPEINVKEPKSNNKGDYDSEEKDGEKIAPTPTPVIDDKGTKSRKGGKRKPTKPLEKVKPIPTPIKEDNPTKPVKGKGTGSSKPSKEINPSPDYVKTKPEVIKPTKPVPGVYSSTPDESATCPSAYSLILTEDHQFIRTYCENNIDMYKFGTWSVKSGKYQETPSLGEPDQTPTEYSWESLSDGGIKFNKEVQLKPSTSSEKVSATRVLDLFGEYEIYPEEKCTKFSAVSIFKDGTYTVVACPDYEGAENVKSNTGTYLVDCIEDEDITLLMTEDGGEEDSIEVLQIDKDNIEFDGIGLRRCAVTDSEQTSA